MISVINHGLGPAVYESVFFTAPWSTEKLSVDDLLNKIILSMKPAKVTWATNVFQGESLIPPGKEMKLLKFELHADDSDNFEIITSLIDETTIHIFYRCLYDEKSTYSHHLNIIPLSPL